MTDDLNKAGMTSPLDEKGLRAAMEAQVGQGCAVREYLDFTAEDAKSFGVNIVGENFAKLDVVRHQQYEDAGLAILSAAIRAYLSATPAPDGMEERLQEAIDAFDADVADGWADAEQTGERPDLWPQEVTVPVDLLRQAQSALAAMRAEQTRVSMGWADTLNALEAAEAQVQRLTEENEALRKGTEPELSCPHLDAFIAATNPPADVIDEIEAARNINSQLRYGLWHEKVRAEAAEARIKALEEALRGILVNPDKTSRAAARAILTQGERPWVR